jgi:hypothetical protein
MRLTPARLARILDKLAAAWRGRAETGLLDRAWEERVMRQVLALGPAPAGLLDRLDELAWAAGAAGATALGLGALAASRLPFLTQLLDKLSFARSFYALGALF